MAPLMVAVVANGVAPVLLAPVVIAAAVVDASI